MDLMNLLRSVEALLYEIVSWLLFYPLTLWRCIVHPIKMMIYAERELTDPPEEQFVDALSPPLFLFLTLVLAYLAQPNFGATLAPVGGILGDERNLLLFRAVLFSLLPLLVGIQRVRQKQMPLNRSTLRPAFYSQCYLAAPFALALELALMVGQGSAEWAQPLAWAVFIAGLVWYVSCLTEWFAIHGGMGRMKGFFRSIATVLAGALVFLTVAVLAALSTM